jgi:hypothetical protein
MAVLKAPRAFVLAAILLASAPIPAAPTETQVKAVFLFNFARFVEWPAFTFAGGTSPFTLCVYGTDAIGADLEAVVRGESISGRPMVVRRVSESRELQQCQILFIPRSADRELEDVLAALDHRATLTVSDLDGAARRGVMIRLMNVGGKVRLRVNVDALRAAHLTVSSNLLRAAEIVGTGAAEDGV